MTANIQQHVVPRHRAGRTFLSQVTREGTWQTRQLRGWSVGKSVTRYTQRGSVTQSTITVGFATLALFFVALLGFFYLQQVFGTASQGSDIQALQSEIVALREQQRGLELEGAQLRSIQSVEERVQKLNLVTVNSVAYLADQPDKVAVVGR